jgi:long-subunit fatty acid transport protein
MSRRKQFALATTLLALAGAAHAQYSIAAPHRGAAVNLWFQDLGGSVGGVDAGFQGTATVVDDSSTAVGVNGNVGKWEIGYTSMSNDTQGNVQATFRFDNQVYTAGDTLRIKHDVSMFDVFRRFTVASTDQSTVHALFGFKVLDLDSEVRGTTNPLNATLDETVPVPMIGFGARMGPKDSVHGFAGLRWIQLGAGDVDAGFLDWSLGAAYQPTDRLRVALGYRQFDLDVEVKDLGDSGEVELDNAGLFFEAGVQF